MPKHWRPIKPDNPDPKERTAEVKKAVEDNGGTLLFCGFTGNPRKWHALVDVAAVGDKEKMWREVRAETQKATVYLTADEL